MERRFAWSVAVVLSCGRSAEPAGLVPASTPTPAPAPAPTPAAADAGPAPRAVGPRYLVGETCKSPQLGRSHLYPLFAGGDLAWTAEASVARAPLTEAPQRFQVLGSRGVRHGEFVTDAHSVPPDPRGFVGESYYYDGGAGPCAYRLPEKVYIIDAGCGDAGNCGISVAIRGDLAHPKKRPDIAVGQVCVVDAHLIGDLDGDGAAESFPLEGFRGPGDVEGVVHRGAPCPHPRFSWYRMRLGADVLDVLGAADLDRDGHLELLVAFTAAGGPRTVAIYTPASGPIRLERRAAVVR